MRSPPGNAGRRGLVSSRAWRGRQPGAPPRLPRAIWGGLVAPVLTYLAVQMNFGFAMPIMISTILFLVLVVISVLLGPETKGKTLTADLEVIKGVAQPAT